MARRTKLTQEMVDQTIQLKADGLSNGDIVRAGHPRVHVLPLGRRVEEPAAVRVKRGTKKGGGRVQAHAPDDDPRGGAGVQPVLDRGRGRRRFFSPGWRRGRRLDFSPA